MRLLIIEDDRTIAENLFEYLESRGHRCDWADGIGLARRLLEAEPFDALVLDRNLPDGDGLSLVRRLRAAGNSLTQRPRPRRRRQPWTKRSRGRARAQNK